MHAKYEVSISYGSKVIAKFKVDRQTNTDKDIDRQTGQKQYAPDHSRFFEHKGGIKLIYLRSNYLCPIDNRLEARTTEPVDSESRYSYWYTAFKAHVPRYIYTISWCLQKENNGL